MIEDDPVDSVIEAYRGYLENGGVEPALDHLDDDQRREAVELIDRMKAEMIEVPEADIRTLIRWWRSSSLTMGERVIEAFDSIAACLPKPPIEVGSKVRQKRYDIIATVVAIDGDEAWLRCVDGYPHHSTCLVASLEVVE